MPGKAASAKAPEAQEAPPPPPSTGERLLGLIERVETLHDERRALGADIAAIFGEAKSAAFDVKAMKVVIARRRQSKADVETHDTLVDTYQRAIEAALAAREAADDE